MDKDKIISAIYNNVDTGFSSIQRTLQDAKKKDSSITYEDVKNWMSKNKQIKPYTKFNSWVAPYARFEYQIDIMIMPEAYTPRYALVVIDTFSKLADAEPMDERNSNTVYEKLTKTFQKMGTPSGVYSDIDGAFMGKVKQLFQNEGIVHQTTLYHANLVERLIRTIKKGVFDRLHATDPSISNIHWTEHLQSVINKYNRTVHSTTKMTPIEAHQDTNRITASLNTHLKASYNRKYPTIHINDKVKIYTKGKQNTSSRKETVPKWSSDTFKVIKIDHDMLLNKIYILEGKTKHYTRNELMLVD